MEHPSFHGKTYRDFMRDMEHICTEMVSVATNYMEKDPRPCLAGRLEAQTGAGYLLAVRISADTPPEILAAAMMLYEMIQTYYRELKTDD